MRKCNCCIKITPFNLASVLLIMLDLIFVVVTVVLFCIGVNNGFEPRNIIGTVIGIGLTVFFGIHFSRYVFAQKIELYDDYFEITYVKNFKDNFTSSPLKLAPIETNRISYGELEKYGFFLQNDLKKGGRNDENRKVLIFSSGNIPMPFIVPDNVEKTQNLFIFNCTNGDAITVDASLYRFKQVQSLFCYLKEHTGIIGAYSNSPLKSITQVPIVRISLGGAYIIFCALISFSLRLLDTKINPLHKEPYSSDYISCYMVGSFVAIISSVASIATLLDKTKKYKSIQPVMIFVSIASIVLTVVCFVLSVWFD